MKNYVYAAFHHGTGLVKFGRTKDPKARYKSLSTSNPHLDGGCFVEAHIYVESLLHIYLDHSRFKNEWFVLRELIPNEAECHAPLFFLGNLEDYEGYKENVIGVFKEFTDCCNKYFKELGIESGDKIKVNYKKRVNRRDLIISDALVHIMKTLHPSSVVNQEEVKND